MDTGGAGSKLAQLYAARLAYMHRRVGNRVGADTAALVAQQAQGLYLDLLDMPVPTSVLGVIRSVTAVSVEQRKQAAPVAELRQVLSQATADAVDAIQAAAAKPESALSRYDAVQDALRRHAEEDILDPKSLDEAVAGFETEVHRRLVSLIDILAENRYNVDNYRRLVAGELLDQTKLALLLAEQSEAGFRRQRESWQTAVARWGLTLRSEPKRGVFTLDLLLDRFLAAIQLRYERPGVLKSVLQALGRGKFLEKLTAEVDTGLQQLKPCLIDMVTADWHATQARWLEVALTSARECLVAETGMDADACLAQLARWRRKCDDLALRLEHLTAISTERTLLAWRPHVQQGAIFRLAGRLRDESSRQTTQFSN